MRWVVGGEADADVDLFSAYSVPSRTEAPFVRANFATSLDGAVEVEGVSRGVSSDIDREVFHVLRALCDVVLVGAQTVRAEGYGPARPNEHRQSIRRELGFDAVPPIAIVTRSGDLDPTRPLFTEAAVPTIVLIPRTSLASTEHLRDVADVIVAGEHDVEAAVAVAILAERGHTRILTEGGPRLFHSLLEADMLDELCLTISPLLAGPGNHPLAAAPLTPAVPLPMRHVLEQDGSVFLRCGRHP